MVAAIVLYTFLVPIRNRQPPVAAEGSRRNLYARRSLAALVLADVNQPHHAFDRLALEAHGQHLLEAAILFHISLQNWIEHLVWGQAVDILLARAQFGGGRLIDYGLRDHRPIAERIAIYA